MLEIMRWFSLGLSLVSFGIASYSLWLSATRNARLSKENARLRVEKEIYQAEANFLRNKLKSKEKENETDAL